MHFCCCNVRRCVDCKVYLPKGEPLIFVATCVGVRTERRNKGGTMPKSETYNCDCMEILKSLPDKSISLILTDAPYGNASGDFKRQDGSRFGGTFDRYKKDIQPELNVVGGWRR